LIPPAKRGGNRRHINTREVVNGLMYVLSTVKGFEVLPRRWIVERTLAWLGRCRRLAKDWKNLNRKALAFLRLPFIRLMLRKLCNQT
jgi:transposase